MDLRALQKAIGVSFKTEGILIQALTRRSYANEHRDWPYGNNERLEFFGDAVLELIVTEFVMANFSDKHEGELTEIRSKLVCNETLWFVGEKINLYGYLFLSKGELQKIDQRAKERYTSCAFEALVGAVYADFGYKTAKSFVHRMLLVYTEELCEEVRNPKTILNQVAQEKHGVTPTYMTLGESELVPEQRFLVGVFFDSTMIAQAYGRNKKQASVEAAKLALRLQDL
jgi:ribonuclease-3